MKKWIAVVTLACVALLASACSLGGVGEVVGNNAPTTGNINDAGSAAQFVPDVPGYTSTDAVSISQALNTVAGGASLISGNPLAAALISQIDGVIQCYRQTGAVSAKIYLEQNISQVIEGSIPAFGTLAVVNTNRVVDNFLPCVLGDGPDTMSAQAEQIQPCFDSGEFTANGERFLYLLAGSRPDVCQTLRANLPV